MKTLLLIMFFGIIISDASAFGEGEFTSPAGDKLKVTDIKPSGRLELDGNDWEFRITVMNEDNVRSSGESFDAVVKIKSGSNIVKTKTITIDPPKLAPAKSYTVTFKVESLVENQITEGYVSIIMDTVQEGLVGMTKEFRLRN
jgi:hypothetical protein